MKDFAQWLAAILEQLEYGEWYHVRFDCKPDIDRKLFIDGIEIRKSEEK